jgi:predicted MFS family arabinose efflux permease
VFVVLGVLNLVVATAVAVLLKPERESKHRESSEGSLAKAAWAHLRNPQLLATFSVGFCVLFSLVAVFTYVTFYLAEPPFNLAPAALGSIFFVYLIGVAANPIAGRAIDRFGHRVVLAWGIGAGIGGVALTLVHSLWMVGVGLTICSTGVFASTTAANTFLGVAAKENRALAVGLYATFYYVGGSLGAAIPGYFWDWGGWPACAAFVACIQAATVVLALVFWKRSPVVIESASVAP